VVEETHHAEEDLGLDGSVNFEFTAPASVAMALDFRIIRPA
jgi:hypothetical protein